MGARKNWPLLWKFLIGSAITLAAMWAVNRYVSDLMADLLFHFGFLATIFWIGRALANALDIGLFR